jgi:lytic murein transglycosylase
MTNDKSPGLTPHFLRFAAIAALGLLAACGSSGQRGPATGAMTDQLARCRAASAGVYDAGSYEDYISRIRATAQRCGIREATLASAFAGTGRRAELTDIGPELTLGDPQLAAYPRDGRGTTTGGINPTRKYVEDRVEQLAERGFALLHQHSAVLKRVEQRYGVPAEYIVAFWGVETNFGGFTGNHDVIETLANLGYSSSRRKFFTEELLGALIIYDRGLVPRAQFKGSYAGAFGQPQFMPTNYIQYAVDFDGNGRVDLYGSLPDTFASIANYLRQRSKWDPAVGSAIMEVRLPGNFPFQEADIENRRDAGFWDRYRVTDAHGRRLPNNLGQTAVLLPAGCHGPAFMVTQNFYSIMDYNPLVEYAMAVAQIAETMRRGEYRIIKTWPDEAPLTRAERARAQEMLSRRGYGDLNADGVMGRETRAAVRRAQLAMGLCPDGYATAALLNRLDNGGRRFVSARR